MSVHHLKKLSVCGCLTAENGHYRGGLQPPEADKVEVARLLPIHSQGSKMCGSPTTSNTTSPFQDSHHHSLDVDVTAVQLRPPPGRSLFSQPLSSSPGGYEIPRPLQRGGEEVGVQQLPPQLQTRSRRTASDMTSGSEIGTRPDMPLEERPISVLEKRFWRGGPSTADPSPKGGDSPSVSTGEVLNEELPRAQGLKERAAPGSQTLRSGDGRGAVGKRDPQQLTGRDLPERLDRSIVSGNHADLSSGNYAGLSSGQGVIQVA
jgi:hypothetical protein